VRRGLVGLWKALRGLGSTRHCPTPTTTLIVQTLCRASDVGLRTPRNRGFHGLFFAFSVFPVALVVSTIFSSAFSGLSAFFLLGSAQFRPFN
jgi:hypothetical protein